MALKDQKDVLIAWINGETIQVNIAGEWRTCPAFISYDTIGLGGPYEYRIKPKEIVTTTYIERLADGESHQTYSGKVEGNIHNLRLTWAEDGKTLLKAEVI
jgi:hypothetical protein